MCLQETHVTDAAEASLWFSSSGFFTVTAPGTVRSCGQVLLYRPTFSLVNSWVELDGRYLMAEFNRRDSVFRIASVYAPNRNPERDEFFTSCLGFADPSVPTILCGDFNAVFDRAKDRRGSDPAVTIRESFVSLELLFREFCVLDVWRHLHPDLRAFTWLKPDGSLSSRIDLIGFPSIWVHLVSSCTFAPCPFSDHDAVFLGFSIPESFPRGPGRWKLNVSILKDPVFFQSVGDFWSRWRLRKSSFSSLQLWWDRGKEHLKSLAVRYCSSAHNERSLSRSVLSALACHLKGRIDDGVVSLMPVYERVLGQLAAFDLTEAEGARVRSRVKWAEEGETSSRFFLRLEKKRGTESWISAMRVSNGVVVTDVEGICESWASFYQDLFTACPVDLGVQSDLLDHLSLSLSPDEAALCDGPISPNEAHAALLGMAKGKSPGSDGLPMEFYVAFWDLLGEDLVSVFNASLEAGLLPFSQREALISLIFKKGDRLDHKNWRPISLLNVDYKLCARVLAGRLLKVIASVVAPDQTCGVPGRYIGENVAFLCDVVELANEYNLPVALLSLDQEKAFDRVDWPFLFATLAKMGFGDNFIRWVRLLYTDVRSSVLVNGYISRPFKPSRGVRQGCPLSPLLYVLSMEVLAANVRCHPDITGLRLPGLSSPLPVLSLYADDTSVISCSDRATRAIFSVYARFEQGTGAKLNLGKCEGVWLGSWRGRLDAPVSIKWTTAFIKILGVYLGNGSLEEENWRPRINAVEKCLNSWRGRSLSYSGKALIVNALALSRVWYVASLIPMPDWVVSELNTLVFSFFWSGKRDLVARDVVYHSTFQGGFGVVSVRYKVHALLAQWVRRYVTAPNAWAHMMTFWFFDRFGIDPQTVLATPSLFLLVASGLPAFYCALLRAWTALHGSLSQAGLIVGSADTALLRADSLTCKSCYQLLLSLNPAQPHCVVKFSSSYRDLDWDSTWKTLFFMPLDRKPIDLCWKVAHGVLYTAHRLVSFGLNVHPDCLCGHSDETLEHLFFHCPLAQSGLDWIQSLLFLSSPLAPAITVRHVLFGFSSDELLCVPRVFCYLLSLLKFFVWCQRNDYRFRSKPPSAVGLITSIKGRLSFYLPLFFKRFRSRRRRRFFQRQWGANGRIGKVVGDSFHFCLS